MKCKKCNQEVIHCVCEPMKNNMPNEQEIERSKEVLGI